MASSRRVLYTGSRYRKTEWLVLDKAPQRLPILNGTMTWSKSFLEDFRHKRYGLNPCLESMYAPKSAPSRQCAFPALSVKSGLFNVSPFFSKLNLRPFK